MFNRQFVQKGGISHIIQIIEIDEQRLLACILTMVLACIDDQLKEYREVAEERPDFTDFLISRISRATDHVSHVIRKNVHKPKFKKFKKKIKISRVFSNVRLICLSGA